MSQQHPSLQHLQRHHRDFAAFREVMVQTAQGRFDRVFWAMFEQHITAGVEPGQLILDLGTGPGTFLQLAAERYPALRFAGVDCQPEMVKSARAAVSELGERVRFVEADIAHPPIRELADGSVAGALASMVLHEMPIPTHLLRELARVLRPRGRALVYDWIRHPLKTYSATLPVTASDAALRDLFEHFSEHCRYTPDDVAFMAEQCGLHVRDVMVVKDHKHALWVLEKPGA